jgi:hypothetical protein
MFPKMFPIEPHFYSIFFGQSMEDQGWEKIGPKTRVKGQQAKKLNVVECWLM